MKYLTNQYIVQEQQLLDADRKQSNSVEISSMYYIFIQVIFGLILKICL